MKKIVLSLLFIFTSLLYLSAQRQQNPLPTDPNVRLGKLNNGLTYYIRHNELPKDRAEFFIAQKAGAILEEDEQNGLAHFLEHMAFNGSKHFPGNAMIDYLESIGVKFGLNLNAGTGINQTVYNISDVPVIREGVVDSCILILHDWSGALTLDETEINKERGVIREEMRSYGGAGFRLQEQMLPQILPGNKYSKRNIIGTADIIMNFKPQTLRDFYHKWYRPDLQAIIIIGDIDVDKVEAKIKSIFADIPAPVNPTERPYYAVEDNDTPLVSIATDKEAVSTQVAIDFKHKRLPMEERATLKGLAINFLYAVSAQMINDRLGEIREKADAPFSNAGSYNSTFANTNTEESWSIIAIAKENKVEDALKSITREIERVNRFGFTPSECERAKAKMLTIYENAFKEKDKTPNVRYAREYAEHFLDGGYIPGIEVEYNILNSIVPNLNADAINKNIQEILGDKNVVIKLQMPLKEGLEVPTKDQLLTWFKEAKSENIQAYQDKVSNEPLLKELPKGGNIKSESKDPVFGTTNFTLSNGVKVVIKPTNFKDNEILMTATSPGGSSLFPEKEVVNIKLYNSVAELGGVGTFSKTDLSKVLAGKQVSAGLSMGLTYEGLSGSSSIKDFETMLQLVYLNFTAPRMDEEAYQAFLNRMKSQLESQEANPQVALIDTLNKTFYVNPARNSRLKTADLEKANYQTIMNWRTDRYKDASDFTFIFVGNINPDSTKALIAQYLGGLPSIHRKETFAKINADLRKGFIKKDFNKQMENPKATVVDLYTGTLPYDLITKVKANMLQQILTIIYTEKVREKEGGTYSVGARCNISNYPKGQTTLQISFETEPTKKDYLNEIIHREFKALATDGPSTENFQKVKEYMLKSQQEKERENNYWDDIITSYYRYNYNGYSDYVKTVNAITPDDIKKLAQTILDQKNLIEVIMTGVK